MTRPARTILRNSLLQRYNVPTILSPIDLGGALPIQLYRYSMRFSMFRESDKIMDLTSLTYTFLTMAEWQVDGGGAIGFRNSPDAKDVVDNNKVPPAKPHSKWLATEEKPGWILCENGMTCPRIGMPCFPVDQLPPDGIYRWCPAEPVVSVGVRAGLWLPTQYMDRLEQVGAPTPAPAPPATPLTPEELRAELREMKLGALQAKAKEFGVVEATLSEALDADSPKDALVQLIVDAAAAPPLCYLPAMRLRPPLPLPPTLSLLPPPPPRSGLRSKPRSLPWSLGWRGTKRWRESGIR